MISVMANRLRFLLHHLSLALCFSLFGSSIAMGQTNPPVYPPWAENDLETTGYNYAVPIDVLLNDVPGTQPIDSSTLTIVSQPSSGEAFVDPILGVLIYDPSENFVGTDEFQYKVADTEGNYSNVATVTVWVYNDPPLITIDYYKYGGDMWVFHGHVTDENPGLCTLTFGGLLEGEIAEPDANGNYELYVLFENGEQGVVSVQATDEIGESSNIAQDYFFKF